MEQSFSEDRACQQLFAAGMLLMQRSGLTAFDFFDPINENEYGVDEDGRVPHVDDSAHRVTIPQGRLNLSVEHLSANFNPLTERNNHAYQGCIFFHSGEPNNILLLFGKQT